MKRLNALIVTILVASSAFASLELKVDWSREKQVAEGVLLTHFAFAQPLMEGDVMRIDLKTPGFSFRATEPDEKWGEPIPGYPRHRITTKTVRVRDFLRDLRTRKGLNAIAAVNTAPWSPFPSSNRYAQVSGLAVSDGRIVQKGSGHATFVRYRDGRTVLTNKVDATKPDEIEVAATGFQRVIDDRGRPITDGKNPSRHPRTAFGMTPDGRYLFWLTVDGRQKGYSMGATCGELGEMLSSLGCTSGVNMDGGGSTTLCYWDPASNAVVTASHATSRDPKVARNVSFSIALVAPVKSAHATDARKQTRKE